MMKQVLIGDTVQVTWVDSGVTPSALHASMWSGSETQVNSTAMTSSGNGHYFGNMTVPNTPGFYVLETLATIDSFPYKRRIKVQATLGEVD